MTPRESQILEIIRENPMISQNEIAKRLDMTRASVSVHIANMIKNGNIKGRGYVIKEKEYLVIIGTCALDMRIDFDPTNESYDPNTSQINTEVDFSYHGAAKNLADNISRLDHNTYLISVIAKDQFGSYIANECQEHGISTEYSLFLENAQTTIFIEVKGKDIDLAGMNSNNLEHNITPGFLETRYSLLANASQIVVEDRLSREAIEYIVNVCDSPKFLITSRRFSYIQNYREFISSFTGAQFSFPVLSLITGMDNKVYYGKEVNDNLLKELAERTLDITKGNVHVLFTTPGSNICYLAKDHFYVITTPGVAQTINDFSHTRDAMMAGYINSIVKGKNSEEILLFTATCNDAVLNYGKIPYQALSPSSLKSSHSKLKKECKVRKLF